MMTAPSQTTIHTIHVVSELEHMEWPPLNPDLNIIEHFWRVLERQVRNRYTSPSCLKELEHVLMEVRLKIPLGGLYDSIHRQIETVHKAGGEPTPR